MQTGVEMKDTGAKNVWPEVHGGALEKRQRTALVPTDNDEIGTFHLLLLRLEAVQFNHVEYKGVRLQVVVRARPTPSLGPGHLHVSSPTTDLHQLLLPNHLCTKLALDTVPAPVPLEGLRPCLWLAGCPESPTGGGDRGLPHAVPP